MKAISAKGLSLVKQFEGFCAEPMATADGCWLVGHGHIRIGEPGPSVTKAQAGELLALDLAPVERLVNALVSQPLKQSQFDALVSFAFSIGAEAFAESQVLRRVNNGDFVAAACAMDAWRKGEVDGELDIVDALVRRRATEKAFFLKDLPVKSAPSALMRARIDHAASILGAPPKRARAAVVAPQFVEANVVSLVQSRAQPKFEPAARLTEILKSEPATEALLLTQAANDFVDEDDGEIVTAHARPVARALDEAREAARRAYEAEQATSQRSWLKRALARLPTVSSSIEHLGLSALLLFGIGLISLGGSLLFNSDADIVDVVAAAALVTPGLAAALMAAFGLWRTPGSA